MTLMTEHLVVIHSDLSRDFPTSYITNKIDSIEQTVLIDLFGEDFYEALVGDAAPFTTDPDDYDSDFSYSDGDFCLFEGRIYESETNNNLGNPINETSFWTLRTKFTTALYESLWNKYLVEILAAHISLPAITYATIRAASGGLIKANDVNTGSTAAGRSDHGIWKDQVRADIELKTRSMVRWMKIEMEKDSYNQEFALAKCVISRANTEQARIGKRRFFFKNRGPRSPRYG